MSANQFDIDHLLNNALVKLPGASLRGLKDELFDVLKEFFEETSIWTENLNIVIIPQSTDMFGNILGLDYNIVPSAGQIIRLVSVVDPNSVPQPAILEGFNTLHFRNGYNSSSTFVATVVLNVAQPTDTTMIPEMPDWVLPRWGVWILDGLLGKMMYQQAKGYSNERQAQYHLARFREGIQLARTAKLRRDTFGTQAWSYPQTFRSGSQRGGISVGNASRFQ